MEYKIEKIEDNLEAIKPLIESYWEEVDERREDTSGNIDYSIYLRLEELDLAFLVTAKEEEELIGFIVYIVSPCTHTSVLKTTAEILFVKEEYRGGSIAAKMVEKLEECAPKDSYIFFTLKTEFPHNKLISSLGYSHVENVYMKGN